MSMDKHYDPALIEKKWYAWWESNGFFSDNCERGGEPYVVVIPPPNVTGILHMGHALNNTIQDVFVRWRRMQGFNTVWVPGTDHAGIATQNVVEKALKKEGLGRRDLGREAFVERVWEWREQYGGTIVRQLRSLGASCDWNRERFTMDEGLSDAVLEVFCKLYEEDLIYKGNYIVNWCPRCQTALSDEESEHQASAGNMWHIRYPVENSDQYITVATTRPETMMGDTAVAVNPKDERYQSIIGKNIVLPLVNRLIPVVADDYVDPAFGTGIVKITPAHDPNDFMVGKRHNLPEINVMEDDGTMNAEAGEAYVGMDRFECRKKVVEDLQKLGLLEKIEDHQHAVGHCYRCDTVVEPRLSKQWFVKMKPLAEPALEVVRSGKIKFEPQRWEKVYYEWMENIRDWCISRQIWWGHRIPVYTCTECKHEWANKSAPETCPKCGVGKDQITQDEDVLDTWFSSWLWPFSVFGWPNKTDDLKFYYPTNDLTTAPEILFFWVARMIMAGCKFMGEIPFTRVVLHGTVRDNQGRKMSKSLGNSLDPLDIINATSADALRFSLMMITAPGQDVQIDMKSFEIGRNFGTKLWNAARFMQMHMDKFEGFDWRSAAQEVPCFNEALLTSDDKHILEKSDALVADITAQLEAGKMQDVALGLYDFLWSSFCDWYLEAVKSDLNSGSEERRELIIRIMTHVFSKGMRLLHPYMPFVTEEIWHQLGYAREEESIMRAEWPVRFTEEENAKYGLSKEITNYVEAKHELITAARALKAEYGVPPSKQTKYVLVIGNEADKARVESDLASLTQLIRAEEIEFSTQEAASSIPGSTIKLGSIHIPLTGLIDVAEELSRIAIELEKNQKFLAGVEAKLSNEGFVSRAPAAVVDQQKQRKEELIVEIARLEKLKATFSAAE